MFFVGGGACVGAFVAVRGGDCGSFDGVDVGVTAGGVVFVTVVAIIHQHYRRHPSPNITQQYLLCFITSEGSF